MVERGREGKGEKVYEGDVLTQTPNEEQRETSNTKRTTDCG